MLHILTVFEIIVKLAKLDMILSCSFGVKYLNIFTKLIIGVSIYPLVWKSFISNPFNLSIGAIKTWSGHERCKFPFTNEFMEITDM